MEDLERKQALANYKEVDVEEVQDSYGDNVFEVDDETWLVVDEEEAYQAAIEDITSLFEDIGMTSFTESFQDWILNNAVDEDYFDGIMEEDIWVTIGEMDDEEVADECINRNIVESDEVYNEESDSYSPELRDDVDFDELRDKLFEDMRDEYSNGYDYCRVNFGDDWVNEEINSNPRIIDMDTITEECISWDGVAHFIAKYDGEEVDLGNGLYGYRLD